MLLLLRVSESSEVLPVSVPTFQVANRRVVHVESELLPLSTPSIRGDALAFFFFFTFPLAFCASRFSTSLPGDALVFGRFLLFVVFNIQRRCGLAKKFLQPAAA